MHGESGPQGGFGGGAVLGERRRCEAPGRSLFEMKCEDKP